MYVHIGVYVCICVQWCVFMLYEYVRERGVCVCVYLQKPEEDLPGAGVTGGYELPDVSAGN